VFKGTKMATTSNIGDYDHRIPEKVFGDPELSLGAIWLYGEISSLSHRHGYCWASNLHFQRRRYLRSQATARNWICELEAKGLIKRSKGVHEGRSERRIELTKTTNSLAVECHHNGGKGANGMAVGGAKKLAVGGANVVAPNKISLKQSEKDPLNILRPELNGRDPERAGARGTPRGHSGNPDGEGTEFERAYRKRMRGE